jgi:chromosome segregation ATPase
MQLQSQKKPTVSNPLLEIVDRLAADRQRLVEFLLRQRSELQTALTRLEEWASQLVFRIQRTQFHLRRQQYELQLQWSELARRERNVLALERQLAENLRQWELLGDQIRLQEEKLCQRLWAAESSLARGATQLERDLEQWNRLRKDLATRVQDAWESAQTLGEQQGRLDALREALDAQEKRLTEKAQRLAHWEARTRAQRALLARQFLSERKRLEELSRTLLSAHSGEAAAGPSLSLPSSSQLVHQLQLLLEGQSRLEKTLKDIFQQFGYSAGHEWSESRIGVQPAEDGAKLKSPQLAPAETCGPEGDTLPSSLTDLLERYRLACEEIRTLQREKEDLAQRYQETSEALQRLSVASPPGRQRSSSATSTDWESQKQHLLALLEAEESGSTGHVEVITAEEHRHLQEALVQAEKLLAEKDQEIQMLQKLLEEQSERLGNLAVGAAAIEELVAQDAIIQQERENARRLREEWEQKLRQAEVELSLERAKIARERAELEERARQLEELARQLKQPPTSAAQPTEIPRAPSSEKSLRRKWFGR